MKSQMRSYTSAGKLRQLSAEQKENIVATAAAAKRSGGFLWLGLDNPNMAEMTAIGEQLALHPLAVQDAATGKQQPKVQSYPEHLFIVMWSLLYANPEFEITIAESFLFVRPGLLVTVQRNDGKNVVDLQKVLDDAPEGLAGGIMTAVYAVMSVITKGYTEVSGVIEETLEQLEAQVFDEKVDDDAARIYRLRKQIGKVDRAVSSLSVALSRSEDHLAQLSIGNTKIGPYFRDLLDDLAGTNQLTTDQNSALDGVVATHENSVASQQTQDARKISAFAAMLAIPAVIAGLYGMNFKNLPGVNWTWGWVATAGAIVALEVWAWVSFHRRHWL